MKENMRSRRHRGTLQGSAKCALNQTKATPCASQTTRAKPFTGKVFYLDLTSNKVAETVESDIILLGGTVEKFFSKEIKYLVSNKREAKYVQSLRQESPVPSPESGPSSPQLCSNSLRPQSHGDKSTSQLQTDTVAISRGKSLVKKVVKEQRIQMNKILSNALEWGVKILYLHDVISYIQKKKKSISSKQPAPAIVRANIKNESKKLGFQKSKGGRISKPFVKVEDSSKHYRPFYLRLTNVPEFNLTTLPPCTPFFLEDRDTAGNRAHYQRGARASASDERPNDRKKKKLCGYCECCLVKYDNITAHLQSDRHLNFAKSDEYLVVDQLVSAMHCNFTHFRPKLKRPKYGASSVLIVPQPSIAAKQRAKDGVNLAMKLDLAQSQRREGSAPPSKTSCGQSPVCRTNERKKSLIFSNSKHEPQQSCGPYITSALEELGPNRMMAPPTGESLAAHPTFSETQLSDKHRAVAPGAVYVPDETESATMQEVPLCTTEHREILGHEQLSENSVSSKQVLSKDFLPVKSVKRKIKVYKRKRRKMFTPLFGSGRVDQSNAAGSGLMRLWELFQDSDDMDVEFHGFE